MSDQAETVRLNEGFMVEVTACEELGNYFVRARDSSKHLECELLLTTGIDRSDRAASCYFPTILDDKMFTVASGNQMLCDALLTQFHIKIIEQLLLFCGTHNAKALVVFSDQQSLPFPVEEAFIREAKIVATQDGAKLMLVMPIGKKILKEWIKFMDRVNENIMRALWKSQRSSPTIKQYLKSQAIQKGAKNDTTT